MVTRFVVEELDCFFFVGAVVVSSDCLSLFDACTLTDLSMIKDPDPVT